MHVYFFWTPLTKIYFIIYFGYVFYEHFQLPTASWKYKKVGKTIRIFTKISYNREIMHYNIIDDNYENFRNFLRSVRLDSKSKKVFFLGNPLFHSRPEQITRKSVLNTFLLTFFLFWRKLRQRELLFIRFILSRSFMEPL